MENLENKKSEKQIAREAKLAAQVELETPKQTEVRRARNKRKAAKVTTQAILKVGQPSLTRKDRRRAKKVGRRIEVMRRPSMMSRFEKKPMLAKKMRSKLGRLEEELHKLNASNQ